METQVLKVCFSLKGCYFANTMRTLNKSHYFDILSSVFFHLKPILIVPGIGLILADGNHFLSMFLLNADDLFVEIKKQQNNVMFSLPVATCS